MKRLLPAMFTALVLAATLPVAQAAKKTLDIYFIDVEGGQATLVVTPSGESLLIDTGFPSDDALIAPAFGAKPGASSDGRDPKRILAAARDAGLKQIDYLLLTHYHADHAGGAVELSQLLPIRTFVDHGTPAARDAGLKQIDYLLLTHYHADHAGGAVELSQLLPIRTFVDHGAPAAGADEGVPGTQRIYEGYVALRAKGAHLLAKPGERLKLKGVDATFVSSDGVVLPKALAGAGQPNGACGAGAVPAQEKIENPHSVGVRLQYGAFRFLDVGDLSGDPLYALACPHGLIGPSDVYLIAHHGGADGADPSMFEAIKPLVAVFNNGPRKGAQPKTLAQVKQTPGLDGWQLHRSITPGAENAPEERLANLDESTSAWIKVSASEDGSFIVMNARNGYSKRYKR